MGRSRRRVAVPEGGFREIAVLRLSSLGDVVLTLPVVVALRAAFPDAKLHYWTREDYADLVRFDPAVDHVREVERDASRLEDFVSMSAELEPCDLIVDLHGRTQTRVLTFRQRAVVLRAPTYRVTRARWVHARWTSPPPVPHAIARAGEALAPLGLTPSGDPVVHVSAESRERARAWRADQAWATTPVAMCPGARHATKRWPEEHWCALDQELSARGTPRIYFSTAAERRALPALAARVQRDPGADWFAGPLMDVAALLGECRAAVSHDSGLMHLAAARGRPVVALFGSTSPVLGFAPVGEGHAVLCRNESCQPCTLHGRDRCPLGHHRCMREMAPAEVLAALESLPSR